MTTTVRRDRTKLYKAEGIKTLEGVSFKSVADAKLEARRHQIMEFLWASLGPRKHTYHPNIPNNPHYDVAVLIEPYITKAMLESMVLQSKILRARQEEEVAT